MKHKPLNDEDQAAFEAAMHDVTPLKKRIKAPTPAPKHPTIKKPIHETIPEPKLNTHYSKCDIGSNTHLHHFKPGTQTKTIRAMQQGNHPIEYRLDCHGMTVEQAHDALLRTIKQAKAAQLRYLLIIHGKGRNNYPILKNQINHWLMQLPNVIGFCSTATRHGGTGAVIVLLSR